MADLTDRLLEQIQKGLLAEANCTVQLLISSSKDPSICNRTTLDVIQKARTLALIQRSHLQRRLRMVQASLLFETRVEHSIVTWEMEG